MRTHLVTLATCFILALALCAQARTLSAQRDKDKDTDAAHAKKAAKVKIVHGPVVENGAKPTYATIAWSTNVKASTILKYGTSPNNLDQTAEARWGGLTHRVYLRDLKPATLYYYRVESTQAQGTGTQAVSPVKQFRTRASAVAGTPPAAAPKTAPQATAAHNLHQFLAAHPNINRDLQKDPYLARNGRYLAQHPAFRSFLQTHPVVRQQMAQAPKPFLASAETAR